MIYFTTFILALFLSQIARAIPQACGDAVPPELPTPVEQFNLSLALTVVTHNKIYGDGNVPTKGVACSKLYPPNFKFSNIPSFPRIGGASNIPRVPPDPPGPPCGLCWKLTNIDNGKWASITAIDHADQGFVISEEAFKILTGGPLPPKLEHVEYSAC